MIDKRNKQRRRKEMHKTIDSTKQRGRPKDPTASHVLRKHKKRDYERNRYVSSLQFQTNKKEVVKKSTVRILTSETKRKTTWLDGTK